MVEVVPVAHPRALDRAVAALRAGEVIVVPTDTVYGVAVDPCLAAATSRLFALKARPEEVALPVLVAEAADASLVATITPCARVHADRHWPGPLTIVLPRAPSFTADIGGDGATVGVRCPDADVVRELCRRVGPLAVTSANRHREPTPATALEIAAVFGDGVALVLDAGACAGDPSTVVDCTGDAARVLRQGALVIGD